MIDIYFVYNDFKDKERLIKSEINVNAYYHFIDDKTLKGKSEAYKLKSQWSSRKTPFIGLYENGKMLRGFYSETKEDVIKLLTNFLNNEYKSN